MAAALPQELVDLILGELQTDEFDFLGRHTIARCGLVCRNWLPLSRTHLFAHVILNDRSIKKLLSVVAASSFPILTFIRAVTLTVNAAQYKAFKTVFHQLGSLPQATTLRTSNLFTFAENSDFLSTHFPHISVLVFRHKDAPFLEVLNAASPFPSFKSLCLESVGFPPLPHESLASEPRIPPHWDSLTLGFMTHRDIENLFEALLSLDTIPILSSLSIYSRKPKKHVDRLGSHLPPDFLEENAFEFLQGYLCHIGSRLRHLKLESENAHSYIALPALEHNTGLESLALQFNYGPGTDILPTLLRVLSHLHAPRLSTVTVDVVSHVHPTIVPEEWHALDRALADECFEGLRTFTMRTPWAELEEELPGHMPLSRARGILRVQARARW
ncbi:hypothetical protein B0H17DRAFT_1049987 [Mycena rosella]|uniref:F-box domain-containing protein n=1 Tax=Mycena rosella TaxID=1033263 RepID=A0AAD7DVP7_MYCRO|nr:hypothetical protein B0H17DRAFT_1049987 [Mycena rosella]